MFRAQGDAAAEVSAIVPSERNERDQGWPRRGRSTWVWASSPPF